MDKRYATTPPVRHGKPYTAELTPNIDEILSCLCDGRPHTSKDVAVKIGRPVTPVRRALKALRSEPYGFVDVLKDQLVPSNCFNNQPNIYRINETGKQYILSKHPHIVIKQSTFKRPKNHELLNYKAQHDIEKCWHVEPTNVVIGDKPREVDVAVSYNGKHYEYTYTPDDGPFKIIFSPGVEAHFIRELDLDSEPLEPNGLDRSSVVKHLLAQVYILQKRTYRKQWGIEDLAFLWTVSVYRNVLALKNLIKNYVPEELQDQFFIQVFPSPNQFEKGQEHTWPLQPWHYVDGVTKLGE